jgi:spore coat protein A, manganese oxidase
MSSDIGDEISRRRFLALTAKIGAALAMAGGLPPVLAACGGPKATTTSGAAGPAPAAPAPAAPSTSEGATTASSGKSTLLDPKTIPKYVSPLFVPPAMPTAEAGDNPSLYRIAVRQFQQQVLPSGFPQSTVWGYGSAAGPEPGDKGSTYSWPGHTMETKVNNRVRVYWSNGLVDKDSHYLPHLFAVDQTLHWANPPGPPDDMGMSPTPYTGPVPLVTHVHGAHVLSPSDGLPESWSLPDAGDIPAGYHTRGSTYASLFPAPAGSALYEYTNDQRATTLWYHDHALGMTRLNLGAGVAGFWLIRDDAEDKLNLPGPAPKRGDEPGTKYYEIPLVLQDRSFNTDGSLFFPSSREFFDGFAGPYAPQTDVPPIWNPEFFGNTITVNGKTWPYFEVEPRLYRFRFLDGSDARTYILKLVTDALAPRPAQAELPFHIIGSDGGLLPDKPVTVDQLLIGNAERYDVILDFSQLAPGSEIYLINEGPDVPLGDTDEGAASNGPADPATTGQVMKFKVVAPTQQGDRGEIPAQLPSIQPFGDADNTRDVTLSERVSSVVGVDGQPLTRDVDPVGPIVGLLGSAAEGPLHWADPVTEEPRLGSTEVWRIANLTGDTHAVHLHQVQFQVLDRANIDVGAYEYAQSVYLAGGKSGPPPVPLDFSTGKTVSAQPWEAGRKDTVLAYPAEVVRIVARFDLPGDYVWHCHVLSHEDNDMMRPYRVVAP